MNTSPTMYGIRVCSKPRPVPSTRDKSDDMKSTTSLQEKPRAVEKVDEAVVIREFIKNFD